MPIKEITIDRWEDLRNLKEHARIYRGQADATWDLRSSLERCCDANGIKFEERLAFETRLWREFRRGFHQYASHVPPTEHRLEWASIMQHYGAPTRLLDFTYSIYVAAYFALEASSADFAAIWSIDAKWVSHAAKDILRSHGLGTQLDKLHDLGIEPDEAIVSALIFDEPTRMVWSVNPFRLNERLRIQRGTFLVPGYVETSHMDCLAAMPGFDDGGRVVKIRIPRAMRLEAMRELFHMNISRTSLFPGLDGYAASLGVYHPTVWQPIKWNS